jgi:hypothetical protein
MKVITRWGDTQAERTISNNDRVRRSEQDRTKKALIGTLRDAGSAPVSKQDVSEVMAAMAGGPSFTITVQMIIGRYLIDEDDLDKQKTWKWKKYGA